MHNNRFARLILAVTTGFWILLGHPLQPAAGGPETVLHLPKLEEAVQIGIQSHPGEPKEDVAYEVKKHLYLMATKKEQLGISNEVREHFEKAVTKAEEKMDSGEGEVTQSAITKLKLGLAGTLNDISDFEAEIAVARLHLSHWMGRDLPEDSEPAEGGLHAVEFPFTSLAQYLKTFPTLKKFDKDTELKLREAFIEVNKAREKMALARKNRKITRALLVTEVANYDFGIGSEGDLFEALIIYTRVLVGYYESIYQFNLTVLDMEKQYAALPS